MKLTKQHITFVIILLWLVLGWTLVLSSATVHSTGADSSVLKSAAKSTINTGAQAKKSSNTELPATNSVPSVQDCKQATYRYPTAVDLSVAPEGVTTITDSTQYYRVYGRTTDEQTRQLRKCAPVGEFAGAASYRISWQYSYGETAAGTCSITEAKIGLHLTMVLPSWSADKFTNASTISAWETFIGSLRKHEQGHYDLSKMYAKQMYAALDKLTPVSCTTIERHADAKLRTLMTELEHAQHDYDKHTDHGTTQGAHL